MEDISRTVEKFEIPEMQDFDKDAFRKKMIALENQREGDLKGFYCEKCRNKGYIAYLDDNGYERRIECDCMIQRKVYARIERSGLKDVIERKTFENYQVSEQWQSIVKQKTLRFAQNPNGWLYVGGQTGAGKTHLCTAVCNSLIHSGLEVRYMLWKTLFHQIDANRFNYDVYSKIMEEIRETDVIYLDDFMKIKDEKRMPQMLDFAFEVIEARNLSGKITIISTEYYITEIVQMDEATAGRIYQNVGDNFIIVKRDPKRNFRIQDKGLV